VAAGVVAVAGLAAFGLLNPPQIAAQSAQTPSAPLPSFEVASIKPNRSRGSKGYLGWSGGRFYAKNVQTAGLIKFAYNLHRFQLSGGPSWVNTEGYDVDARVEDSLAEKLYKMLPSEQVEEHRRMVQSLLEDRFQLRVRCEIRDLPTYALVVAKNGPKFQESKPGDTGVKTPYGTFPGPILSVLRTETRIRGGGSSMAALARLLSQQLGRTVLDQTGLKGKYDYTLRWTRDEYQNAIVGSAAGLQDSVPITGAPASPESPYPSIFTAIQEQLGLKLQSLKAPGEVLVIDHIERPSVN
jgi:uncharacterized protein (TIGR03435 family)